MIGRSLFFISLVASPPLWASLPRLETTCVGVVGGQSHDEILGKMNSVMAALDRVFELLNTYPEKLRWETVQASVEDLLAQYQERGVLTQSQLVFHLLTDLREKAGQVQSTLEEIPAVREAYRDRLGELRAALPDSKTPGLPRWVRQIQVTTKNAEQSMMALGDAEKALRVKAIVLRHILIRIEGTTSHHDLQRPISAELLEHLIRLKDPAKIEVSSEH